MSVARSELEVRLVLVVLETSLSRSGSDLSRFELLGFDLQGRLDTTVGATLLRLVLSGAGRVVCPDGCNNTCAQYSITCE